MRMLLLVLSSMGVIALVSADPKPPLLPAVEIEETIYTTPPANNGAGPLWCYGSTCLARLGDDVFASGIETLADQKPLNNVRWMVFRREGAGWTLQQTDPEGRQREPCPLGVFDDGRLLLTSDPTLTPPDAYNGSAQPQLLIFDTRNLRQPPQVSLPQWQGAPAFTEHSYRAFCVDANNREALYLQNVGYDTSHFSFLDRTGKWSKSGSIKAPWGAEFEEPQPIRVCYQQMALRDGAAHIMGVSDIIEWVREWREYKLILNEGRKWDYDFRRLYYCWTPDIQKQPFGEWIKVADCDRTCGHISNLDLWLDPQGRAHILWLEQSVWNPKVRDKFFPDEPVTHALMYGIIDRGKVVRKVRLAFGGEKQESQLIPGWGRFQATPDGRLFVFYYTSGTDESGKTVAENRLLEIYEDGAFSDPVRVDLACPFTSFMTATERGGSAPSATLDLYGAASGREGISYARIALLNNVLAQFSHSVERTPTGARVTLDGGASKSVAGPIKRWAWEVGGRKFSGKTVSQDISHGGPLTLALTVTDAAGNSHRARRTVELPPAPSDFGLKQWGLVLRVEAEQFAAEGGGEIHVRHDKLNSSGLSLSHSDPQGSWLEWEFEAPVANKYFLTARYAVPASSARAVMLDGQPLAEFVFPATGGYGSNLADHWGLASMQVEGRPLAIPLSAGRHSIRFNNVNGLGVNLDYLELVAATAAAPDTAPKGWCYIGENAQRVLTAAAGTLAPTQMRQEIGACTTVLLGPLLPGDATEGQPPSTLRLFEDGKELGPAHAVHADIRDQGRGRFSHWKTTLYFSASDNSDPRRNGRKYTWEMP